MNPPRQLSSQHVGHASPCCRKGVEIEARGDAEALKQVDQILRRCVTRSARSIGTTPYPRHRTVKLTHPEAPGLVDIGDRHPTRVVHVECERVHGDTGIENTLQHTRDVSGGGQTDRVPQNDA